MATYKDIQKQVKRDFGFVAKSCWIADVFELNGCQPRVAPNRKNPLIRQVPCPPDKRRGIEEAMRSLGLI